MKKLIATALITMMGVGSAPAIAHNDNRIAMGVLGGIILGSALQNRYVVPHVSVGPYGIVGGISAPSYGYYNSSFVYPAPLIQYSPSVYMQPMVTMGNCITTVYNPYLGRNENVVVNCYR